MSSDSNATEDNISSAACQQPCEALVNRHLAGLSTPAKQARSDYKNSQHDGPQLGVTVVGEPGN